ncbi:hypothetical protein Mgra_00001368 [Meloidogyne graminicola]|uniref:Transmembrane protein 208 n=1 Tax=Meloidogyne graminicola TaxID=189291 RepID=A0A8T0A220_9BILA|nr:hypothetical protein Mgra_00001368 [Meloidogyne graminicola]
MSQKHVKQAARGQRQIYEENRQTIIAYSAVSAVSLSIVGILNFFVFNASRGDWIGLIISFFCQLCSIGLMSSMMKGIRNEKNQIIDAGLDLNDPQAFGEYCKDVIILSVLVQIGSLFSVYFYFLMFLLPMFGIYKLWTKLLGPWFFAPAPELDENNDGKKKKRKEKTVYLRR